MPEVTVTARQSLALGTRPRPGAPGLSHRHIPGSVLRGALAEEWVMDHGEPSAKPQLRPEFVALFERGVRFGPLFAPGSTIVPLSVLTCKYQPDEPCMAGWYDEAWGGVPESCPRCDGPLSRGSGAVIHPRENTGRHIVRTAHVELTAEGTAEEGKLFTREAIAHRLDGEPARFTGRIVGGGDWLLGEHRLHIGGRRSVAGAVSYQAIPDTSQSPPEVDTSHLVVRLLSPGVFVDRAGRPCDVPDVGMLERILGVSVKIERQWTRRDRVGGWHAAADLPKPEDHVVTAGSTYRLELDKRPDPEAVQALLDRGLGLRRAEGYGWIEVRRWQPPAPSEVARRPEPDRVVQGASEMVLGLPGEHTRWMISALRGYALHLQRGGARHTDLLNRPRFASLTEGQRRQLRTLLTKADVARIAAIADTLEARLRGVEP